MNGLTAFLLQWLITGLSLWITSHVFKGIKFENTSSLVISALLLGFVNAVVRPVMVFLTLPLSLITFGFFLLVINALMIKLVAWMVKGFTVSSFWTAFFASIFIALLSWLIGGVIDVGGNPPLPATTGGSGTWL